MPRLYISIIALIALSILLTGDPTNSLNLSSRAIPGTAMLSGALLMVGVAVWIRD